MHIDFVRPWTGRVPALEPLQRCKLTVPRCCCACVFRPWTGGSLTAEPLQDAKLTLPSCCCTDMLTFRLATVVNSDIKIQLPFRLNVTFSQGPCRSLPVRKSARSTLDQTNHIQCSSASITRHFCHLQMSLGGEARMCAEPNSV